MRQLLISLAAFGSLAYAGGSGDKSMSSKAVFETNLGSFEVELFPKVLYDLMVPVTSPWQTVVPAPTVANSL